MSATAVIAVVGAGLIGRSWAIVFARAGHRVQLFDAAPDGAERALAAIDVALADLAAVGLIEEPAAAVRARIVVAGSLEVAVAGADLVQESTKEEVEAKRAVFRALDAAAPPGAILASSTSTIPASVITDGMAGRARMLVAHPVNPPHLVPLVELSPAPWTDPAVVARARALYEACGQVPVEVRREIEGFLLNRLQAAVLAEAYRLYADGYASAEDLDRTMRDGLGLRWSFMGPFETIDLNAPAGVPDYMERYGALMGGIAASQVARPWDPAVVDALAAERRAALPADQLPARGAWRDRRLARLIIHKRDQARREAERSDEAGEEESGDG
jgi:L-gulonate 3-dehydrogenase